MEEKLFELRPEGFRLNEEVSAMYGRMNGINVLIQPFIMPETHRVTVQVDIPDNLDRDEFLQELREISDLYPFVTYIGYLSDHVIALHMNTLGDSDRENLAVVMEALTKKCEERGLYSCCEFCQNRGSLLYVSLNGDIKQVCENCADEIQKTVTAAKPLKENVFLGIIGAVIGTFIGSLLWILLDQIGFIAGIAGYAIVYCGIMGYEKLGKRISKKSIIICIILSILTVFLADVASIGITMFREVDGISLLQSFLILPFVLGESEILKSLIINLVIGYIFGAWGSFSFVRSLWNAVAAPKEPARMIRL